MSDTDAASGDAAKAKPKTSGWSGHALLSVLALLGYRRYGLVLVAFRHERRRWIRMALLAVCVLFGAAGAVFFLSFGVILLFWGTHRLAAVAGVVLLYVLVGLLALRAFHRTRKRKRGFF